MQLITNAKNMMRYLLLFQRVDVLSILNICKIMM